jgi:hypothetical protein
MNSDKHSEGGYGAEAVCCQQNRVTRSQTERAGARPYLLVFGRQERNNVWLTYLIRS